MGEQTDGGLVDALVEYSVACKNNRDGTDTVLNEKRNRVGYDEVLLM